MVTTEVIKLHKMKWIFISGVPGRKIYNLLDITLHKTVAQVDNQVGGWGCWMKKDDGYLYHMDPFIKRLIIDAKEYVKAEYLSRLGKGQGRVDSKVGKVKKDRAAVSTVE